jgi:hypothetical protein
MEKTKTKKPAVMHNLRKIKALLFLSMRQQTEKRTATAREIAIATGGNADSLYVLLQRWHQWGLIRCIPSLPYTYMIADEGQRYLSKIDDWFFSGYYSRKRKRRVRGYRGKMEDLKKEIAIASKAIFWWRHYDSRWDRNKEGHKGTVYYIKAPFEKAEHFVKVEGSYGRAINWNDKTVLLVVKFDNVLDAYQSLPGWGCKQKTRELGQAIVDAHIGMVWSKDE